MLNKFPTDYPVDPHKIAAISSAFSSRHLPPKRSKMHRVSMIVFNTYFGEIDNKIHLFYYTFLK